MKKITIILVAGLFFFGSNLLNAQDTEDIPVIVTDKQVEIDDDILSD